MEQFNLLLIEYDNHHSCYTKLSQRWPDVSVTVANNENEALIALLYTRFQLILLDTVLAEEEVISLVNSASGLNCKAPVIVMLETHESHLKARYEALQVVGCWLKPINIDAIEQFIRRQKNTNSLAGSEYIQILLDKTQNNKNLAIVIFKKLFIELPQQIHDIDVALQQQHYKVALEITHKLHGSVGFCGFSDMQQQAYALENCLLHKDYQTVIGHFDTLKTAIVNFVAKKNAILNTLI